MTRAKLQEILGSGSAMTSVQSFVPAVPSGSFVFTREFGLGSEGDDVLQLQVYLAADSSLYPEGKITGYYGSLTVSAVKRFQARYGISQVGRVGPQTMAKLNELMGQGMGVGPIPQVPPAASPVTGTGADDEAARAALQNQINDLQSMVDSLLKQMPATQ